MIIVISFSLAKLKNTLIWRFSFATFFCIYIYPPFRVVFQTQFSVAKPPCAFVTESGSSIPQSDKSVFEAT